MIEQGKIKFTTRIMLLLVSLNIGLVAFRMVYSLIYFNGNEIPGLIVTPFFGVANIYISFILHNSFTNFRPSFSASSFESKPENDSYISRWFAVLLLGISFFAKCFYFPL